jgi:hypothetical protein
MRFISGHLTICCMSQVLPCLTDGVCLPLQQHYFLALGSSTLVWSFHHHHTTPLPGRKYAHSFALLFRRAQLSISTGRSSANPIPIDWLSSSAHYIPLRPYVHPVSLSRLRTGETAVFQFHSRRKRHFESEHRNNWEGRFRRPGAYSRKRRIRLRQPAGKAFGEIANREGEKRSILIHRICFLGPSRNIKHLLFPERIPALRHGPHQKPGIAPRQGLTKLPSPPLLLPLHNERRFLSSTRRPTSFPVDPLVTRQPRSSGRRSPLSHTTHSLRIY